MSLIDNLGMDIPVVLEVREEPPEDRIQIPIEVQFTENGYWFALNVNRAELTKILKDSQIEGRYVERVCIAQLTGDECDLKMIIKPQSYPQEWSFE